MVREIAYERVETELETFSYPVLRDDAAAALADVTVTFRDGDDENLGVLVSETQSDAFDAVADLRAELATVVEGRVEH
jgi:hypothetical protein